MKNELFDCKIEGKGKGTILIFETEVCYSLGSRSCIGQYGSQWCYEDDYDYTDYTFEISLTDFLDEFGDDFDETVEYNDEWFNTLNPETTNNFLNTFTGDMEKLKEKIQLLAQERHDR